MTGRAGGMLSMIDSQQLLTYDNLTTAGSFSDMDVSPATLSLWLFLSLGAVLACGLTRRLYLLSRPQMLEVCNEGLSLAAQRSQFAIWSIMTSPLILGNVSHHRPLSSTVALCTLWV